MRNKELEGFNVIYLSPIQNPRKKKKKYGGSAGSVVAVEIPDIGLRYIKKAYGGASCDKHDNCFTCQEEECTGGRNI